MTLYNKKDIATLLDKFMAGATTIEEEQILTDYFRSEQRVPTEWEDYKDMFAYFDNGMVEVSEQKEDIAKARLAAIVPWKRIAVAAILLILIGFAGVWINNTAFKYNKVAEKMATAPIAKRQLEVENRRLAKNESEMQQSSNLDNQEIAAAKPIVNKKTVKARKVQALNGDAKEQYRAKAEQAIEIARQQAEDDIAMVSKEISDAQTNVYVASQQAQGIKVVYNENGTIYYRNCSLKSKNIIEL
ncbi:hypothetical protein [Prevotella intermedia]|uniref:hypothetical protein n=1 Tax=Prevotella intermedia TaxID=28131 RepID=UPI002005B11F|nr:hypothetical protein [Prevotella intermedia]MCK6144897.1 hypothetical protein [Prevotella intermedia]